MGKKEEDRGHHNDTVNVEEKQSLMEALHRTHSNSSSSSDDEEVEEGSTREKKKKKKGLKDKTKEKISGDHDQQKSEFIPMDNCPAPHEED
ncbi:phosphoprotein ECPP44-like [Solanum stenotomum]|uniref:phosphoprotein ECPP44-like n=1 Tax=Solanum stenotomum TaxID=172797 RepID=UPI0020D0BC67|nr:phosphoprotein ECPP44-like [Solanum stenotomum]